MSVLDDIIRRLAALESRVGNEETRENPGIGARVYNSANISVANNAVQALTFDSERYDTASMHSTSVNTSRLTCTVAGWYAIGAHAIHDANATGVRGLYIRMNGATFIGPVEGPAGATAARGTAQTVVTVYQLAVGDYVEAWAFQNSGAALNVLALGNYSPEFWMHRLC
jgi:hypothetical protein